MALTERITVYEVRILFSWERWRLHSAFKIGTDCKKLSDLQTSFSLLAVLLKRFLKNKAFLQHFVCGQLPDGWCYLALSEGWEVRGDPSVGPCPKIWTRDQWQ